MKKSLEIIEEFMRLTNDNHDIEGAMALMDENISFIGPAVKCSNRQEYGALLEQFLSAHTGWKKHQTFENGEDVCFITDIHLKTPNNQNITIELSEWFKLSNDKIIAHKVFYDPTEFNAAFGLK